MAKVTPITEHFQYFVADLKESFWGDRQRQAVKAAQKVFRSTVGMATRPLHGPAQLQP